MGINDFRLRLVGTQHYNEDGMHRQEELGRCRVGEAVQLVREPDNPADPAAVAVRSARGVRLGYLGSTYASWVGSKIDRGYDVRASIGRLTGGIGGLALGAVLSLNMDGEDPAPC